MENKHGQMISISKSYHDTLLEFGKNWVKIMLVAAIPQAVVYLLLLSAGALGLNALTDFFEGAGVAFNWSYLVLALVIVVVAMLVSFLGLIALYYMVIHHEEVSVGSAFEHSFKYLLPYSVQAIIAGVVAAIGTAAGYLLVSIIGTVTGLIAYEWLIPVFNVLSLILPYAAGTAVSILFYFAGFSVIEKDEGGLAAIKHSVQLVRGHFWPVLVRGVLLTLVVLAISYVIGFIPYVGAALGILTLTPFSIIYVYILYKDLQQLNA